MRPSDERDFSTQLEEALPHAYITAYRLLRKRTLAQDACQEAAARAWAAQHRYQPSRPFYPWFYVILRNHCFDLLTQPLALQEGLTHLPEKARLQPDEALLMSQRAEAILEAIETLSEAQRAVIELRHFQDLNYQEMAEILQCPEGTVMSRLYRARKALRRHLLKDPRFKKI